MMKVLAIGANPDDVEFLCAGTLAVFARRGDPVAIAYLTQGDKGSATLPPARIATIRRREAREAAAVIGAELFALGIPDGEVVVSLELRRRLVEVIRAVQPDLVITHHPQDYMSDHVNCSHLVLEAVFWAGSRRFRGAPGRAPHCEVRPPLYYMDTVGGIGFVPQEYVDITDVIEVKADMLSRHESQLAYMKQRDGLDFLDCMRTAARYRGYQCGVRYAEGFIPERVYPSLSPRRLLP
jgi:LmbE family N-acetylglucosaminyl deacetylase